MRPSTPRPLVSGCLPKTFSPVKKITIFRADAVTRLSPRDTGSLEFPWFWTLITDAGVLQFQSRRGN